MGVSRASLQPPVRPDATGSARTGCLHPSGCASIPSNPGPGVEEDTRGRLAERTVPPEHLRGELHRHVDRVVRLLHLRHRRGAGVRDPLLPAVLLRRRHAGRLRHVRGRVHRPAAGRRGDRALRRPHRAQGDARPDPAAHRRGDGAHRPAADVRGDRRRRPAAARAPAPPAGLRRRRGVGRRGPHRHRARVTPAARGLRQLRAVRCADRRADVQPRLPRRGRPARRVVRVLGLAHPVPAVGRARRGRLRRAQPPAGRAGVRAGQGEAGDEHGAVHRAPAPPPPGAGAWRASPRSHRRPSATP